MTSLDRVAALAYAGKLREAAEALGETAGHDADCWRAYLAMCRGEFDDALTLALGVAETSGDAALASRALVTGGSTLRQTGRHLAARPLDEGALRLAPDETLRTHALIGLAADAVGLGRERECAEHLDEAAALAPPGEWRARVRLAWVRCEHALLARRARKAITHARDALDRAKSAGARRHEAKSHLFLGVALREAEPGDPDWRAALKRAADIAARIGAAPIGDAARALLPDEPARRATKRQAKA